MLLPGRQLPETGHGSHPATASPGRGPACCHTGTSGSPSESSQGLGVDGPVRAGSPDAPVTAASSSAQVTGLVLFLAPGCRCSSPMGCMEQSGSGKAAGSERQNHGRPDGSPGRAAKLSSHQGYRHVDHAKLGNSSPQHQHAGAKS